MGRAFVSRSDCPISSIAAVSGSLIEDCTISSIPEPIWTNPEFFFFPPTTFNAGCFCPPKPSVNFAQAAKASFSAWVSYPSSSETGVCEPLFNFFVRLGGGACPDMSTEQSTVERTKEPIPQLDVSAQSVAGADCATTFHMNFGVPCVNIDQSSSLVGINLNSPKALNFTFMLSLNFSSSSSSSSSWNFTPECVYVPQLFLDMPTTLGIDLSTGVTKNTVAVGPPCTGGLPNLMYIKSIDSVTYTPPASVTGVGNLTIEYTRGVPWGKSLQFTLSSVITFDGKAMCNPIGGQHAVVLKSKPTVGNQFELAELDPLDWGMSIATPTSTKKLNCNTTKRFLYWKDSNDLAANVKYLYGGNTDPFEWYSYKMWMPQDKWVYVNSPLGQGNYSTPVFFGQLKYNGYVTLLSSTSWQPNADAYFGTQINVKHTQMSNFPAGGRDDLLSIWDSGLSVSKDLWFVDGLLVKSSSTQW